MFQIKNHHTRIVLKSPALQAEILPFGALLNRFEIALPEGGMHNLIAAFDNETDAQNRITQGFFSAKLSPFVCRLNQGRYTFNGKNRQTGKHWLNGHAIHGLLYDAPFRVVQNNADNECAWVDLVYDYAGNNEGFPFPYRLTVRYSLFSDGLQIATTVKNTGSSAFPLADGWHPYFCLDGCADDWSLHISGSRKLVFNDDLLPTGEESHVNRFLEPHPLADIKLDNSFLPDGTHPAARLLSRRLALAIDAEENYPLLQIYIPPNRMSVAIENLSGAPDCFNNGIGLITLAPAQSRRFSLRYRPSVLA